MASKMDKRNNFLSLLIRSPKTIDNFFDCLIMALAVIISVSFGLYIAYYMMSSSPTNNAKGIIAFSFLLSCICFLIALYFIRFLLIGSHFIYLFIINNPANFLFIIKKPTKINKGFDRIFIVFSIMLSSASFVYIIRYFYPSYLNDFRFHTLYYNIIISVLHLLLAFFCLLLFLWIFRGVTFLILWINEGFKENN
jgi:hypothetical protein